MSDSVDRVFVQALNTVKRIPRTGSARPPPSDRLKLYGLYKQSMEGDVEGVMNRPEGRGVDEAAEQEKWDAWSSQHGISRTEAKRRYISTLIETMHKYASTTSEARELVAELEFVWDQIKSNSASSAASSPDQPLGTTFSSPRQQQQRQPYPSYASIGPGRANPNNSEGLKKIRPISDGDVHSESDDTSEEDFVEAYDDHDMLIRNPISSGAEAVTNPNLGSSSHKREYEIRNRKWRKRIEQTLIKITTELTALREQSDAAKTLDSRWRNKRGWWTWLVALVMSAARHILIDAILTAALMFWIGGGGGRGDARVHGKLDVLVKVLKERLKLLLGRLRGVWVGGVGK